MNIYEVRGRIHLESDTHVVEYEPEHLTGARTLYLKIKGGKHCISIFDTHIDEVIDMLQRGKRIISAVED